MAYKPLSQTVTNGKTAEVPSSDAIFDKIAADIGAIPASANPQLSNLGTTAVNANINMGTNQLRFNAGNRSSSISINALADVATGITTSANNATTINTSASITDVLQIGDIIYLDGLATRAVVLTKPSSTQITVSRALGNNTVKEIFIEPQFLSGFNSTTRQIVLDKNARLSLGVNANTIIDSQITSITTGTGNVVIGRDAGVGLVAGTNNVLIGRAPGELSGNPSDSIVIGAGGRFLSATSSIIINTGARPDGGFTTTSCILIGTPLAVGTKTNLIAIGFSATGETGDIVLGNRAARVQKCFFGHGGNTTGNLWSTEWAQARGNSGTNQSSLEAGLFIRGTTSTGTGIGGSISLETTIPGSAGSTENIYVSGLKIVSGGNVAMGVEGAPEKLTVSGNIRVSSGDLLVTSAGKGLKIAEGDNATIGVVTLAAGTATVNTSAVKSNSRIMLTNQNPGGTVGFLHVSARTADTSFVITSSEAADTSDVAWLLVNPLSDPDVDAFITATGITDATQKEAVFHLVLDFKRIGVWSKIKAVYPFVGSSYATQKYNLKDPQDTDAAFRLTEIGAGWTYGANGATSAGAGRALNTHLNASTELVNNDLHYAVDLHNIGLGQFSGHGILQAGNNLLFQIGAHPVSHSIYINTSDITLGNYPTTVAIPKTGLHLCNSSSVSRQYYRKNDRNEIYQAGSGSALASSALPNFSMYLLAANSNNVVDRSDTGTISFASYGSSFTMKEAVEFCQAVHEFKRRLGRNV